MGRKKKGGAAHQDPAAGPGGDGAGGAAAPGAGEAEGPDPSQLDPEDCDAVEAQLTMLLQRWAADGSGVDEQARRVRRLLAAWHPDRQRDPAARDAATRVFQYLQDEVARVLEERGLAALRDTLLAEDVDTAAAVRAATKAAKAAARDDRLREKAERRGEAAAAAPPAAASTAVVRAAPVLRVWPRSHFSMTPSPLPGEDGEVYIFGGEWFNGQAMTFYSDLYKGNLAVEADASAPFGWRPSSGELGWRRLYTAAPGVPGPAARSAHQLCAHRGSLYLFGGEWASETQRRFRQFGDLWCFDAASARWRQLPGKGAPDPRSGHRMCVSGDSLLVFGGFTEGQGGETMYRADLNVFDLRRLAWMPAAERNRMMKGRGRPSARAGGLFWAEGDYAYAYGGTRQARGAGRGGVSLADALETLTDLWRLHVPTLAWTQLDVDGADDGPGKRSGLASCAWMPQHRIVFGGVTDLPWEGEGPHGDKELSVFHADLWALELPDTSLAAELGLAADGDAAAWRRRVTAMYRRYNPEKLGDVDALLKKYAGKEGSLLAALVGKYGLEPPAPGHAAWRLLWSPTGERTVLRAEDWAAAAVPGSARGGGVDAMALVEVKGRGRRGRVRCPRGRISAQCSVAAGHLYVFGGACEAGPRKEATLDDLWRVALRGSGAAGAWECVLPLSDRCSEWFDSDSDPPSDGSDGDGDDDGDDDGSPARAHGGEWQVAKRPAKQKRHRKRGKAEGVDGWE